jgi:hypothetical protein
MFDPSVLTGIMKTGGINNDEQIVLYNDSLYGMTLTFGDRSIDIIPPQWSKDFIKKNIPMGDIAWNVFITIQATGYPVSQCYGTVYEQDEHIPSINAGMQRGFTLTGGNLNVNNTTLSNEGQPSNLQVVDIGTVTNPSLWLIDNDHFAIAIEIAGVKHVIFVGSITGNPLQIGQSSDTAEFKGNVLVDGTLVTGTTTLNNGASVTGGDINLNSAHNLLNALAVQTNTIEDISGNTYVSITPGATTRISSNTGGQVVLQLSGATQFSMNGTDVISQLQYTAPKYILGGSSGNYAGYVGSWSRIATGTYTSSTSAKTVNHGLGAAPTNVMITGGVSTSSSSSGADTYGATTFTVIDGFAGVTMRFRAERA